MSGLRNADVKMVATFLDIPVGKVQESLDTMSDSTYQYLDRLFEKFVDKYSE